MHAYYMDERALVAALISLEARGLELIGFYHSHPHSDPIPSPTDVRQATYPDTPYLIVGLKDGAARLAAWQMRYGQVSEVPLHVGSEPPPESPQSLSQRAKNRYPYQRADRLCAVDCGIFILAAACARYPALTGERSMLVTVLIVGLDRNPGRRRDQPACR